MTEGRCKNLIDQFLVSLTSLRYRMLTASVANEQPSCV